MFEKSVGSNTQEDMFMETLQARPYAGEADLQPIIDLINAYRATDPDDDAVTLDGLRLEMQEPGFDPARDTSLWEDERGALVGFAQIYLPEHSAEPDGFLWFRVHPSAVGSDLEDQVVLWAEERVREASRERGVPVKLRSGALRSRADRRALLERHGMEPVRYFFRMARSLGEPMEEPRLPEGFTFQHTRGMPDAAAWVDVFNQSFIDHWNHHPATVEEHTHWLQHPSYRAEHDLVAVAPDGTFAAFCFCVIDPDENAANGRSEGTIRMLGTRRGYRKLGLGRAMLLHGMHRLKADGMDQAVLGVDAANPSGALRLYESVGFHTIREFILYSKDV